MINNNIIIHNVENNITIDFSNVQRYLKFHGASGHDFTINET